MAYKSINQITLIVNSANAKSSYSMPIGTGSNTARMSLLEFSKYINTTLELNQKFDLKADKTDTYTKLEIDGQNDNFQNQIDDLNSNVGDVYTKSESDALLDLKADKSDTYTKSEIDVQHSTMQDDIDSNVSQIDYDNRVIVVDSEINDINNALNEKADQLTTYTKDEINVKVNDINSKLATKADSDDLNHLSSLIENTYTKPEIDSQNAAMQDDIDLKAPQESTYTIDEVDSLLANKADTGSVVTLEYVDTQLDFKADKVDVYTKAETYATDELYTRDEIETTFVSNSALLNTVYLKKWKTTITAETTQLTFDTGDFYILNGNINEFSGNVYRNGLLQQNAVLDVPEQILDVNAGDLSGINITITLTDTEYPFQVDEEIMLECLGVEIIL